MNLIVYLIKRFLCILLRTSWISVVLGLISALQIFKYYTSIAQVTHSYSHPRLGVNYDFSYFSILNSKTQLKISKPN